MGNVAELLERKVEELIRKFGELRATADSLETENRELREKIAADRLKLKKLLDTLDNLGL